MSKKDISELTTMLRGAVHQIMTCKTVLKDYSELAVKKGLKPDIPDMKRSLRIQEMEDARDKIKNEINSREK